MIDDMEKTQEQFDQAIAKLFDIIKEKIVKRYREMHIDNLPIPTLSVEPGKRYIRVVESQGSTSKSVFCFIDKTNGDILKAASWKAPARHKRGNVFDKDNGAAAVTAYGAVCFR